MIEIFVLFLGPSIFSILLYFGLKRIASPETKKIVLFVLFVLFSVSIVLWMLRTPDPVGPPPVLSTLIAFTLIAFSSAYPVALAMSIFPGIFTEKVEAVAAALAPLISIPFIVISLLSPEAWDGKTYGDMFSIKLPLIGWIIDPFTSGWTHTTGGNDPFPGLILYFGFFIEMIIVMLLVFWYLKMSAARSENKAFDGGD